MNDPASPWGETTRTGTPVVGIDSPPKVAAPVLLDVVSPQAAAGAVVPLDTPAPSGARRPARRRTAALLVSAVVITVLAVAAIAYAATHTGPAARTAAPPAQLPSRSAQPSSVAPSSSAATTSASDSSGTSGGTPATTPSAATVASAVTWIKANLPKTATIRTTSVLLPVLQRAGYAGASATTSTPDWLLVDPAAASLSAPGTVGAPVAQFGTGSALLQVQSVLEGTASDLTALRRTDLTNRLANAEGLVSNGLLTTTDSIRSTIRRGGLDVRAETFLAMASRGVRQRVVALPQDAAEQVLGRPVRTLTLVANAGRGGATAIAAAVAAQPPDYTPSTVDRSHIGLVTFSWTVAGTS